MKPYDGHKLLIANRGEIAVRVIRTAKQLGLRTVAIYTPSDALSPHVLQADEPVPLPDQGPTLTESGASEATAYLSAPAIIAICKAHSVTLVHPGYGFLSENADFAEQVVENGITWLGPQPKVIRSMGIKHEAREIALKAGVEVVPGSDGLVKSEEEALEVANRCGFPVILKATAGGGGMGMVVCHDEDDLKKNLAITKGRAQALFDNDGVFLERYYQTARHIEIQIFGNGLGDVVHMRERECSVQRRHQKVIEESPSPFCMAHPGLREKMCEVAVNLARSVRYASAGTVEFLVDEETAKFYFLEMNTRIQVEHPVTEEIHPGLDLVELMIKQGIAEISAEKGLSPKSPEMRQETYDSLYENGQTHGKSHSIEARLYAENPYEGFIPSPGLLQYVDLAGMKADWLRIDSWIDTGMTITPHFDPLLAKAIVTGSSREKAISRFLRALDKTKILGPPNNKEYLKSIAQSDQFSAGLVTTRFLETFLVYPSAFKVLSSGIDMTIQDLPGRTIKLGIPRSGPMDDLAFAAGNIIVGNPKTTEGLEIIVVPGVGCSFQFFVPTIIAVTGKEVAVKVNGVDSSMWSKLLVPLNGKVSIEAIPSPDPNGFRVYMCVRGGFPDIPVYLGSKSTSMGLGGYQGRSLMKGDFISLKNSPPPQDPEARENFSFRQIARKAWKRYVTCFCCVTQVPVDCDEEQDSHHPHQNGARMKPGSFAQHQINHRICPHQPSIIPLRTLSPSYPTHWVIYVLPGPHDDEEFITAEGIEKFYSTNWRVSSSSNRLGIRLEAPTTSHKIQWARNSGGEGGSHPSNILDNGYAPGTINVNGDTPIILTNEGPDMGGYLCMCTVATAEMWKLGQLAPGSTVQFRRISWRDARHRLDLHDRFLDAFQRSTPDGTSGSLPLDFMDSESLDYPYSPVLHTQLGPNGNSDERVTFRQAGDSAILVEFGEMHLDIFVRAKIHAFQGIIGRNTALGILSLCPCIRSILCYYDPKVIDQAAFLQVLVEAERSIPQNMNEMTFPGRRITFPIVLDDKWNKEALKRYMSTTRDKAVYLPSNVEYLANNNGLSDTDEALHKLIASDWLVLGIGFYLACPFLIPIDPRCRLIGQKMNPSRTFTPRGAIGIAGPVAAIYPIESPGGYQLYGRTLPAWQTWGKGKDFHATKPWLLEVFDQVTFSPVTEEQYLVLEKQFDAGQYAFKVEQAQFSVEDHSRFLLSIDQELKEFRSRQAEASRREEIKEQALLREWEEQKIKAEDDNLQIYNDGFAIEDGFKITAFLFATVWKINCKQGDTISTDSQILIVLEAMKTEIPILAGVEAKGKKIRGFGNGIREGASVRPGDTLLILE